MRGDDRTNDRQSQSRASGRPVARVLRAPEALEEVRQIRGRDARPLVDDAEHGPPRFTGQDDPHVATGRGVPRGVVDQVADHLLKPVGRAQDLGSPAFHRHGDPPVGRDGVVRLHRKSGGASQVDAPERQLAGRPFDALELEEVVGEPREAVRLADDGREEALLILGAHLVVEEGLGRQTDPRERGPKLVTHGGDEA